MESYTEMKLQQIEEELRSTRAALVRFDKEMAEAYKRQGRRFTVLEIMLLIGFGLVLFVK